MRYYMICPVVNHSICSAGPLIAANGDVIDLYNTKADKIIEASVTVPLEYDIPDIKNPDKLTDFIKCGSCWIVSPRAKALFETMNLPTNFSFIKTRIQNRAGMFLADYFTLYYHDNLIDEYNSALDLDSSTVRSSEKGVLLFVESWAFHPNLLPIYDVFHLNLKLIVTEQFRKLFRRNRITNAGFVPIWSPEEGPITRFKFPPRQVDVYENFEDV